MGAKCPRDGYYYIYEDALKDAHNDAWLGRLAAEKYVILSLISKGGMGAVYRAMQLPVQREVAFKVLLAELQDNDKGHDRFAREARAISKLTHPNIITMHDFGVDDDDHPFMVMEYAPGKSLSEWIVQPGLDLGRIEHVFRQILSALSEAHNQGVVHRDLKPENLIVTRSGTDEEFIKLLDFGIARMVHDGATRGLTREGEVFGTPHYMAPEQAQGQKEIGPPADVYALGIMLYEMLSGQCPFDAPTPLSILYMHINDDLPKLTGRNGMVIPAALREVIDKATAKEADQRYATAGEMLEAFDEALGGAMRSGEFAVGAATVNDGGQADKEARLEKATANTLMFGEVQGDKADADPHDANSHDGNAQHDSAGDISSQPTAKPKASKETTFEFEDFGPSRTKKLALVAAALVLIALVSAGVMLTLMPDDGEAPQPEATAQGVNDGDGDDQAAQQAEVAARQDEEVEKLEDDNPAEDGADKLAAEPAEPNPSDSASAAESDPPGPSPSADGRDGSADRGDKPPENTPSSNAPAPADSDKDSQDDDNPADSSDTAEEPKDESPAPEKAENEADAGASSDEEPVEDDGPRKFERKNDAPKKFERKGASDDDDKPRKWR